MLYNDWTKYALAAVLLIFGGKAFGQTGAAAVPNPYQPAIENWAKLPADEAMGR